jgi:hypothetical protein
MMKKLLYVLLAIVVAYLGLCAFSPDNMNVVSKNILKSSPESVYAQIADFKKWPAWSYWSQQDPAMKDTYSAVTNAVGSFHAWSSKNPEVGTGKQTISELVPNMKVQTKLEFEGTDGIGTSNIVLKPTPEGGTEVTWDMIGEKPVPFPMRGMFFAMNMKQMLLNQFNTCLANIDSVALANPISSAADTAIGAKK